MAFAPISYEALLGMDSVLKTKLRKSLSVPPTKSELETRQGDRGHEGRGAPAEAEPAPPSRTPIVTRVKRPMSSLFYDRAEVMKHQNLQSSLANEIDSRPDRDSMYDSPLSMRPTTPLEPPERDPAAKRRKEADDEDSDHYFTPRSLASNAHPGPTRSRSAAPAVASAWKPGRLTAEAFVRGEHEQVVATPMMALSTQDEEECFRTPSHRAVNSYDLRIGARDHSQESEISGPRGLVYATPPAREVGPTPHAVGATPNAMLGFNEQLVGSSTPMRPALGAVGATPLAFVTARPPPTPPSASLVPRAAAPPAPRETEGKKLKRRKGNARAEIIQAYHGKNGLHFGVSFVEPVDYSRPSAAEANRSRGCHYYAPPPPPSRGGEDGSSSASQRSDVGSRDPSEPLKISENEILIRATLRQVLLRVTNHGSAPKLVAFSMEALQARLFEACIQILLAFHERKPGGLYACRVDVKEVKNLAKMKLQADLAMLLTMEERFALRSEGSRSGDDSSSVSSVSTAQLAFQRQHQENRQLSRGGVGAPNASTAFLLDRFKSRRKLPLLSPSLVPM